MIHVQNKTLCTLGGCPTTTQKLCKTHSITAETTPRVPNHSFQPLKNHQNKIFGVTKMTTSKNLKPFLLAKETNQKKNTLSFSPPGPPMAPCCSSPDPGRSHPLPRQPFGHRPPGLEELGSFCGLFPMLWTFLGGF